MRKSIYVICLIAIQACSQSEDRHASAEDIQVAKATAATEAKHVLELAPSSMEQEKAILSIRAHESAIRQAGFDECADSFAAEAQRILNPILGSNRSEIE